jgi:hypothetical protein
MNSVRYLGMDVHRDTISVAVLDESGRLMMQSVLATRRAAILDCIQREAALRLLDQAAKGRRRTLGADKQYQEPRFVEGLRQRDIVPHVAEYERGNLQRNSLREEGRNGAGFQQSQRKRKLVEQSFAWIKHWAGFRQVKLQSRKRWNGCFRLQPQPTTWSV